MFLYAFDVTYNIYIIQQMEVALAEMLGGVKLILLSRDVLKMQYQKISVSVLLF